MQITLALNLNLGAALIIVLILASYLNTYNTDIFQRKIVVTLLFLILIPIAMDFLYNGFQGMPGRETGILLYLVKVIYYSAQLPSFYYSFAFIDYACFKSPKRSGKILAAILIASVIHFVFILFNLKWKFYYSFTPDNIFSRGDYYYIRYLLYYPAALLTFIDVVFLFKSSKRKPMYVFLIVLLFCLAGSVFEMITYSSSTFYVFFSAAMLYAYFFIIKINSSIDLLTGLGNRMSFNEFMSRIGKTGSREFYAIVMIDMDHFKQINDTFGHLEGDNALKDMAAIIKSCLRSTDFSARYGGDEFIIAAKNENNADALIKRIYDAIDAHNKNGSRPYKIEMSYGQDIYTTHSDISAEEFLNHIDSLMYKNKNERRRASDKARDG